MCHTYTIIDHVAIYIDTFIYFISSLEATRLDALKHFILLRLNYDIIYFKMIGTISVIMLTFKKLRFTLMHNPTYTEMFAKFLYLSTGSQHFYPSNV